MLSGKKSPAFLSGTCTTAVHLRNEELDDILASDILDDVVGKEDKKDIEAAQRTHQAQAREAAELTRTVASNPIPDLKVGGPNLI